MIPAYNRLGFPATYAHGHNRKGERGRKHSPETLAKITAANRANGEKHRGPNHPQWKGGISDLRNRFRDPRYKVWHLAVLARDNYTCQHCHRQFKPRTPHLAAHHLKGYTEYPELRYDLENGLCLCGECHMAVHGKHYRVKAMPLCACGCGKQVLGYKKDGTPATYLLGHNALKGRKATPEAREAMRLSHLGKQYSDTHRAAQRARRARERLARQASST
jgi:hypothetical protein